MSGEQALREMQLLHPGVRVLLTSGYNEVEAVQRFAGKGLAGFIQKPYTSVALASKIKEVLNS
jgi:two-component system cell cycle sensor histidine kinase/response regulator CckA